MTKPMKTVHLSWRIFLIGLLVYRTAKKKSLNIEREEKINHTTIELM
jgi:hypothetical protein